ncbi:hypothetical protein AB4853_16510 [Bradyrhizobium sp. 1050_B9_N1_2]|uniref:hypothetical protein n=1 Tax=Bradyrhizobium sp. 1050_B9_N1_2 TaxID=3238688 RepID=UPI003EDC76FB
MSDTSKRLSPDTVAAKAIQSAQPVNNFNAAEGVKPPPVPAETPLPPDLARSLGVKQ